MGVRGYFFVDLQGQSQGGSASLASDTGRRMRADSVEEVFELETKRLGLFDWSLREGQACGGMGLRGESGELWQLTHRR